MRHRCHTRTDSIRGIRKEGVPISSRITIQTGPDRLDLNKAYESVSGAQTGGVALFVGTVRSPNDGRVVDHLDYEVWEEHVDAELERLAREALAAHGAERAYVAHRTGPVDAGEPSVMIAVSAVHRDEAFRACRQLIDTLKDQAPIWKKEIFSDSEHWVGMPEVTDEVAQC